MTQLPYIYVLDLDLDLDLVLLVPGTVYIYLEGVYTTGTVLTIVVVYSIYIPRVSFLCF